MRFTAITLAGLLTVTSIATAGAAEVPRPIATLLGPGVGYLLFQSDLCGWGLTDKIKTTYQDGFKVIGMTASQQTTAWTQAADTQKRMAANISSNRKAKMKADTCSPSARDRVERDLGK